MKINKKILCVILTVVLMLLTVSCSSPMPLKLLETGAEQFAAGKTEKDYHLRMSDELLAELIQKYSDGVSPPDIHEMTDEEIKQWEPDPTPPKKTDSVDLLQTDANGNYLVRNMEDVYNCLNFALSNTLTTVSFTAVDGFDPNFMNYTDDDWYRLYEDLERRDPVGTIGRAGFWFGRTGHTYLTTITYTMGIEELKNNKAKTEALVDEAISKMNVQGKSEYEIVYAVNQYLCDNVYYPDKPYPAVSHMAFGALKNGCAVCEGYTAAAALILPKLGVDCDMQFGFVKGVKKENGYHVWNLVKIEGQWYQLDITWNDAEGNYANQYFLVTDEYMRETRTWDENAYPHSAKTPYRP